MAVGGLRPPYLEHVRRQPRRPVQAEPPHDTVSGVSGRRSVVDDPINERFIIELDGHTPELVYRVEDDRLVLLHAQVPERFRGRGLAGQLVAAAVERAATEGLTVVPLCPYVRKWLEEHPEAAETVKVGWHG
jgi:predicted GNAT family acetyltransferase